jgi:hypothetical protein
MNAVIFGVPFAELVGRLADERDHHARMAVKNIVQSSKETDPTRVSGYILGSLAEAKVAEKYNRALDAAFTRVLRIQSAVAS